MVDMARATVVWVLLTGSRAQWSSSISGGGMVGGRGAEFDSGWTRRPKMIVVVVDS